VAQIGIVGSGIGGIAFAIRMACLGQQVHVFEANAYPGGKLAEITLDGYRFDAGPSLFTLPQLVDELFTLAGKNPREYLQYERLPEICRYFWEDGTRLNTHQDPDKTSKEIAEVLGESATNIRNYIAEAGIKYNIVSDLFLDNSLHKLATWTGKKALTGYANLHRLGLFETMHTHHQKRFLNPKTAQLFDRYATYNGSDPYQTPATLSIIPHLEYNLGAYFPSGGMIEIPRSLTRLAKDLGVEFHLEEPVTNIRCAGNQVTGLDTTKGTYDFDYVASNADIRPTYDRLLPEITKPKKLLNQPKSSSGIIFYWGVNRTFDELGVHNIFFAENYKREFDAIFKTQTMDEDPTAYVHISSKVASEDAPAGCEKHIVSEDYLDPRRIETRTSSSGGALYGNASNNKFAAFLRHPNYRPSIKNLYWIGGSVHPGGGIPLCLSSAKIAAKLFQENA
jgi:phytoene desaturase